MKLKALDIVVSHSCFCKPVTLAVLGFTLPTQTARGRIHYNVNQQMPLCVCVRVYVRAHEQHFND